MICSPLAAHRSSAMARSGRASEPLPVGRSSEGARRAELGASGERNGTGRSGASRSGLCRAVGAERGRCGRWLRAAHLRHRWTCAARPDSSAVAAASGAASAEPNHATSAGLQPADAANDCSERPERAADVRQKTNSNNKLVVRVF